MSSPEKVTLEVGTVLAWHDAVNSGDGDTLVDLSSDDVELGGPHGSTQGLAALRSWAADADITLRAGRMFVHDGVVVVQEQASPSGAPEAQDLVASAFRVVDARVVSVFRHPDLDTALAATGLGPEHEFDPVPDPDL
ncbi:MAG: nuclear transport factor 2 family protein [Mycobacteriaceae bacterium]